MAQPEAFITLYERDAEAVLLFFTRRTLDVETALDLTAETFAQAWCGWPRVRLDSTEEVRGWLFTIARRQLSHYWRRGRVERRALQRIGMSVPVLAEDEIAQIERAAEVDEARSLVGAALGRLSGEQRGAIQLRIIEELPYPEVARAMGISEQTARARVSRGLRALAATLEPTLAEERYTP